MTTHTTKHGATDTPQVLRKLKEKHYADTFSDLLGIQLRPPISKPTGWDRPAIAIRVSDGLRENSYGESIDKLGDAYVDALIKARESAGITRHDLEISNHLKTYGAALIDITDITKYDQKHGEGALVKKLLSAKEAFHDAAKQFVPSLYIGDKAEGKQSSAVERLASKKADTVGAGRGRGVSDYSI